MTDLDWKSLNSMVVGLTPQKEVIVVNNNGLAHYRARVIILTMGCRERTRGAIGLPGTRPAGIYTAGVAQELINLKNYMVGEKIVVLGSGDVGCRSNYGSPPKLGRGRDNNSGRETPLQ